MRGRSALFRTLLVTLAPALLFALGCGGGGVEVEDVGTRAVVIGIDGADWRIIDGLIAEGGMPNVAALRERGAWGSIETLPDVLLSPVIWTSVATGKTAAKHGVSWFMVDSPDGTRVPVRSHNPQGEGDLEHPRREGSPRLGDRLVGHLCGGGRRRHYQKALEIAPNLKDLV
jgi:hypothetical protein